MMLPFDQALAAEMGFKGLLWRRMAHTNESFNLRPYCQPDGIDMCAGSFGLNDADDGEDDDDDA